MKKTYKACLLGDTGVGKTTLFRLVRRVHGDGGGDTTQDTGPTTATERHVLCMHAKLNIQFIDVPGAPQYRGMLHALYQSCDVICFLYDCTNASETLRNLENEWLRREIWHMAPTPTQKYIVVGTKTDVSSTSKCPPPELASLLRACSEQMGGRECVHIQVNDKFMPLVTQFVQAVEAECGVARPERALSVHDSSNDEDEDLLDALVKSSGDELRPPLRRTCMSRAISFFNTIKF